MCLADVYLLVPHGAQPRLNVSVGPRKYLMTFETQRTYLAGRAMCVFQARAGPNAVDHHLLECLSCRSVSAKLTAVN